MRRAMFGGLLVTALAGCGPSDAVLRQRERLGREQAARLEALDRVEARLEALRAREILWHDLELRRQQVTQIACENVAGHVAQMEEHEERFRARLGHRRRVARLDRGDARLPVSTD